MEAKGVSIEANTLYPLLRRLEKQALLESCWNTEGAKPRKYYKISSYGEEIHGQLCKAYFEIVENTNQLIMEDNQ